MTANEINCKTWKKIYNLEPLPARIEELANTIVGTLSCFPCDWKEITACTVKKYEENVYGVKMEFEDGFSLAGFQIESMIDHLKNADFKTAQISEKMWVVTDISKETDDLLNEKVLICNGDILEITLAEAIQRFGIQSEGNPADVRRFARCPRLNGLLGPMYPNHGFVARYESQEVYNMLSI